LGVFIAREGLGYGDSSRPTPHGVYVCRNPHALWRDGLAIGTSKGGEKMQNDELRKLIDALEAAGYQIDEMKYNPNFGDGGVDLAISLVKPKPTTSL
jgi:hypothetical protein